MNKLKRIHAGDGIESRRLARLNERFVVVLATVGLTAAINLAAVGPDVMRADTVSIPAAVSPSQTYEAEKTSTRPALDPGSQYIDFADAQHD